MRPAEAVLLIAGAYLLGAIPWGVVIGRVFYKGTDLREHGSKSTGATNAYRVLGGKVSASVFVLDFVKGLAPVLIGRALGLSWWVIGLAGLAAVVGHCWSVFIGFTGGKGVATGAGAIIAMAPWTLLILPAMIAIILITRYVSLASLAGTALATAAMFIAAATDHASIAAAVAVLAITVVVFERHRGNIERLRNGTERRLQRRRTAAPV